jgi:anti-sigma factor RsiW
MSCHEPMDQRMHDYLDEELTTAQRTEFEAHLAACPECMAHLTEIGSAIQTVTRLEWVKAPGDFTESLLHKIGHDFPKRRNWRRKVMQYSGIAAAVVLVFGLGVSMATPDKFALQADNTQGIIVEDGKVIVPEGTAYNGDLVIQNGDIEVRGKVNGNVTALNGKIYRAAGADISGETVVVDQAMEKIAYYAKHLWTQWTKTK